jgi:hypothetical protein
MKKRTVERDITDDVLAPKSKNVYVDGLMFKVTNTRGCDTKSVRWRSRASFCDGWRLINVIANEAKMSLREFCDWTHPRIYSFHVEFPAEVSVYADIKHLD